MVIYKITNKINNKCYIGQTAKKPEERWEEHIRHSQGKHINDQNKHLYRAMRKYGIKNFTFEVIQDSIQTEDELNEAEIYWIHYYNSFLKGYNENFGGQYCRRTILPIPEIVEEYHKVRSMNKVAKKYGVCVDTISDILKASGAEIYTFRQSAGKRIRIKKDSFEKEFDSVIDCAEWFFDQRITKASSVESIRTSLKIARRKNSNHTYYGYYIENIEE